MNKRSLSGIPFKVVWVTPPGHIITYPYDHFVWIQSSNFKTIFGRPRKQSGKKNFVKISFDSGEIRSIYRIIETAGYKGISQGFIGLSYNSLCDLSISPVSYTHLHLILPKFHFVPTWRILYAHVGIFLFPRRYFGFFDREGSTV